MTGYNAARWLTKMLRAEGDAEALARIRQEIRRDNITETIYIPSGAQSVPLVMGARGSNALTQPSR